MIVARTVGQNAAVKKYDMLTGLGAFALSQDKGMQRLVLRLITLITARYNWRRDEVTIGRREIARLWQVNERTVKREMAKLKGLGWVEVKRAGTRGRVTTYRLKLDDMLGATRPAWDNVGPDYAQRMAVMCDGQAAQNTAGSVVPFVPKSQAGGPDSADVSLWGQAKNRLYSSDNSHYLAWIAPLRDCGERDDRMHLRAPSKFHAHYVQTHFLGQIVTALEGASGRQLGVVIDW